MNAKCHRGWNDLAKSTKKLVWKNQIIIITRPHLRNSEKVTELSSSNDLNQDLTFNLNPFGFKTSPTSLLSQAEYIFCMFRHSNLQEWKIKANTVAGR